MDERMAKRLAKLRAELAEMEREEAAEAAAKADPASQVVDRREGKSFLSTLWSAVIFLGLVVVTAGLLGGGVTLSRLAGDDFDDAKRVGQATVTRCDRHGPITNMGFGYWERCYVKIRWDDGDLSDLVNDGVFTSADIGKQVRVGDLGMHRTSQELARADAPYRPWLRWIGIAVGLLALPPGFLVMALIWATFRVYLRRR